MRVSTQEIEHRQVVVDIEVDDERLERAVNQAYRRMVGRLNVPGFRKGKAPRALVERMVGREALLDDAIQHLVPDVYREAVETEGLKPAGDPHIEVVTVAPLLVKATVPLEPRVELGDYRAFRLTPDPTDVSEEEIDELVKKLREAHSEWVPVERAVQVGDRVALDIRATVGDRTVLDSKDAEYVVDPDGRQPAPGFSHQLVAMEPEEERHFNLSFPEDMKDDSLAGKEASFEVKLHWVKERQLPEMDDAFASSVGQFENMEVLRAALREERTARKVEASRSKLEAEILDKTVAGSTIEQPPQLAEQEAERLRDQFARSLDRQGITVEQYIRFTRKTEAEFRDELLAEADRSVKRSAVLAAVADAESVEVADAEVDEEIGRLAPDSSNAQRQTRSALTRPEIRERVRAVLRERKAVHRLVALATEAGPELATSQKTHGEAP